MDFKNLFYYREMVLYYKYGNAGSKKCLHYLQICQHNYGEFMYLNF